MLKLIYAYFNEGRLWLISVSFQSWIFPHISLWRQPVASSHGIILWPGVPGRNGRDKNVVRFLRQQKLDLF